MSPRIPQYERSVGLTEKGPAVEVDSRSYAVEALAQSELWGTVGKSAAKVADLGFDINDKMIRAKMSDDFSNMVVKYNTDYYALRDSLKDKPPEQREGLFKEGSQKLMEDTLTMSSYPGVQTAFKRHWAMHFPAQNSAIRTEARKEKVANFHGNVDVNLNSLAEMVVNAPNEVIRTQHINEAHRILEEGVLNGLMQPHQKEVYQKKFDAQVAQVSFDKANEQDPLGTKEAVSHRGAFGADEKMRIEVFKPHNERAITKYQHEQYDQVMKGVLDAVYNNKPMPFTTEQVLKMDGKQLNTSGTKEVLAFIEGAKNNPGNKSDEATKTRMWTVLTTGQINGKDIHTAEGKQAAWEMVLNPQAQLKAEDRIGMMKDLRSQEKGDEKEVDKAIKGTVRDIRTQLKRKPRIDQEFFSAYLKDKQENPDIYADSEKAEERLLKLGDNYIKKAVTPIFQTPQDDRTWSERNLPTSLGGKPAPGQGTAPAKPFSTGTMTPEQARQKLQQKYPGLKLPGDIPGRAAGGPVEAGQDYLVGERGPELMVDETGKKKMVGQQGPEVINPDQSGQIVPNDMLKSILNEYPGLQKAHSMDTTSAMFADSDRIAATKKAYGKEDIGGLEYWPKEETGMPGLPHPTGGKGNVLEIYDESLKSDPKELHTAILGDLLHGMPKDPGWAKMRDEFAKNFSPAAKELIKSKNCPPEARDSMIDAFIRGAMMPYKGGNWKDKDPDLYSEKQMKLLDKMQEYLKSGKTE